MTFVSTDYFFFLTLALALFWSLRHRAHARLSILFFLSCIFYMTSHPWFILLILGTTLMDYFVAQHIEDAAATKKKWWLIASVSTNLLVLGYYKYSHFIFEGVLGIQALTWLPKVLPLGISFYTFESLSYCVDVYRGHTKAIRNPLHLTTFITFFPKLVAGPIVRAGEFMPQLERKIPSLTRAQASDGLFLIATGLTKKVLFSDYLSINIVDRVFDNPEGYTATEVLFGLYGFTLQMYADFSGYTDCARGSAKLFGFELPENFDRPYQAQNPAEFWRRWHMSLSTWIRDYLYYPLGGSKHGATRTYLNLWVTIFVIGIWHGASWNFVLYGAIQATAVALHRVYSKKIRHRLIVLDKMPVWMAQSMCMVAVMQLVVFSRILFRANDFNAAKAIVKQLFTQSYSTLQITPWLWAALLMGYLLHYTPRSWYESMRSVFSKWHPMLQAAMLICLALLLASIQGSKTVPYIYFQF